MCQEKHHKHCFLLHVVKRCTFDFYDAFELSKNFLDAWPENPLCTLGCLGNILYQEWGCNLKSLIPQRFSPQCELERCQTASRLKVCTYVSVFLAWVYDVNCNSCVVFFLLFSSWINWRATLFLQTQIQWLGTWSQRWQSSSTPGWNMSFEW